MSLISDYQNTTDYQALHSSVRDLVDQFEYEHLPPALKSFSEPLARVALANVNALKTTRYGGELSTGLRKLLESKDCFVRAARGV